LSSSEFLSRFGGFCSSGTSVVLVKPIAVRVPAESGGESHRIRRTAISQGSAARDSDVGRMGLQHKPIASGTGLRGPSDAAVGSGHPALVAVVQSADLRESDDSPGLWRLDRSSLRAVFF
jgi:hypothetical protein